MLFSTQELRDYHPSARDGEIGRVRDVLFDDQRWGIRHLVIDTGSWLSGRDVLVSPHAVEGEVTGYDIAARDGHIGHVDDFLFDDRSWQIRYAVVDTRNWLPGRLVLVSPQWIDSVDWAERAARVRLTREAVKSSPPYDREKQFEVEDERRLASHYAGCI